MLTKLRSLYRDPLYRNSIAMMLNSAFAAFFGLLFWIVAARGMLAKGAWNRIEVRRLGLIRGGEAEHGILYGGMESSNIKECSQVRHFLKS